MQSFYQSERYLRLVDAARSGDHLLRHAIVEEGIAETHGAERAQWLLVRAGTRVEMPVLPLAQFQAEILEAIVCAPGDKEVLGIAGNLILCALVMTEQLSILRDWRHLLPTAFRGSSERHWYYSNLAQLATRRDRPRSALRYQEKAMALMAAWSPDRLHAFRGRIFLAHCDRALIALDLGWVDQATQDVARATELYETVSKAWVRRQNLTMAEARLALAQGDPQGARQHLQSIYLRDPAAKNHTEPVSRRIDIDRIAADIALAEGNRRAYAHFSGRALELAEQNELVFTIRRIRRERSAVLGESEGERVEL